MLEQIRPDVFAVGLLAVVSIGLAIAAYVTSLRSSPARAQRERTELLGALEDTTRRLQQVTQDNADMRDEWAKHRVTVTELLDDAVSAMETTERRRRSARTERRRAEEVREGEEQQPASYMCAQCRYEHLAGEDCMSCARRRLM